MGFRDAKRPKYNKVAVSMLISAMKMKLLQLSPPPAEEYDPLSQLAYENAVARHRYLIELLQQHHDALNTYETKQVDKGLRAMENLGRCELDMEEVQTERDNAVRVAKEYGIKLRRIQDRIYRYANKNFKGTDHCKDIKALGKV
jgi:hypothetical protein